MLFPPYCQMSSFLLPLFFLFFCEKFSMNWGIKILEGDSPQLATGIRFYQDRLEREVFGQFSSRHCIFDIREDSVDGRGLWFAEELDQVIDRVQGA